VKPDVLPGRLRRILAAIDRVSRLEHPPQLHPAAADATHADLDSDPVAAAVSPSSTTSRHG
jgi:hypothetical protein